MLPGGYAALVCELMHSKVPGIRDTLYIFDVVAKHFRMAKLIFSLQSVRRRLKADKNAKNYMDTALTPVDSHDTETLEMFSVTQAARANTAHVAAVKARRETAAAT